MIKVSMLHVSAGDNEKVFDDVSPENRALLGALVNKLIQDGENVLVNLADGTCIIPQRYDPDTNEWVIKERKGKTERKSAEGSQVSVSPRTSGG